MNSGKRSRERERGVGGGEGNSSIRWITCKFLPLKSSEKIAHSCAQKANPQLEQWSPNSLSSYIQSFIYICIKKQQQKCKEWNWGRYQSRETEQKKKTVARLGHFDEYLIVIICYFSERNNNNKTPTHAQRKWKILWYRWSQTTY